MTLPAVINARLKACMERNPKAWKFIVNVRCVYAHACLHVRYHVGVHACVRVYCRVHNDVNLRLQRNGGQVLPLQKQKPPAHQHGKGESLSSWTAHTF